MTKKQVVEIFDLCLRINGLEERVQTAEKLPTVFCQFYGHTAQIEVQIYLNGWHDEAPEEEIARFSIPTDKGSLMHKICLDYLQELAKKYAA